MPTHASLGFLPLMNTDVITQRPEKKGPTTDAEPGFKPNNLSRYTRPDGGGLRILIQVSLYTPSKPALSP